ncbi:MAG: glycosyltransferase family 39 protein [Candidatus Latescibacterota bacterium]|nr:glycosyltransferase family 39 protein [Candidatus Latescibacterota bacterium]
MRTPTGRESALTVHLRHPLSLAAIAVAIRALYLFVAPQADPQDTPDYDEIALNLLAGKGFVSTSNWFGFEIRSWRPPGYPVFLSAVYAVFGYHHVAVQLIQALLGGALVLVVHFLARQVEPGLAVATAIVVVVYPPLVHISSEIMSESLLTLLLTTAMAAGLRAAIADRPSWSLAVGVLVGAASLTRPVALLVWPALLLGTAVTHHRAHGQITSSWSRGAGWFSGALLLTLLPWTLRNYAVHDAWVPISTHGGFILARSNGPDPGWRKADGWGIERKALEGTPSEVERDHQWRRQALDHVRADPARWLRLCGERFLRFWYPFRPDYNIGFVLILPLAAAGFARFGLRSNFLPLSALCALSVVVFSCALYGSTRFRLPLEPIFLLYACAFGLDWWRRKRSRMLPLAYWWVAVNALIWWQQEAVRGAVVKILQTGGLK